jgi:outer membrane protein assembly factor BamB
MMMKIARFALSVCMLLFIFCQTDKSPTSMDISSDGGQTGPETPVEYVSNPQTHIDWPTLAQSPCPIANYNPQRVARSLYTGPQQGRVKWSFASGGKGTYAPVIAADGTIYFPSKGGFYEPPEPDKLFAVSPQGRLEWYFTPEPKGPALTIQTTPIILADNRILLGTSYHSEPYGKLYILNPDGTIYKEKELPYQIRCRSGLVDLEGNFYFTCNQPDTPADCEYLICFYPDLTEKWRAEFESKLRDYAYLAMSPDGSTLLCNKDFGFYAIDPRSGSVLWEKTGGAAEAIPVYDNSGNIYDRWKRCGFICYTSDGVVQWQKALDNLDTGMLKTMGEDFGENTLDYKGYIYAYENEGIISTDNIGQIRWYKELPCGWGHAESPPTVASDSTIYVAQGLYLYRYDPDGNLMFECQFSQQYPSYAASLACGDVAYLVTADGTLIAVE